MNFKKTALPQRFLAGLTAALHLGSISFASNATANEILSMDASRINSTAVAKESTKLEQLCAELKSASKDSSLEKSCSGPAWAGNNELQVRCKLREAAKNSQAIRFCQAREDTIKAKKHLQASIAVDAAASAACFAEALTFPAPVSAPLCGIAAIGAGASETVRVIQQYSSGMGNAKGGYKVNEEGQGEEVKSGILGLGTNLVPIAAAAKIAKSYFSCKGDADLGKKGDTHHPLKDFIAEKQKMEANIADTRKLMESGFQQHQIYSSVLDKQLDDMDKACSRRVISFKAGVFFGGLAAFRFLNRMSADKTLKSVEESLRGLIGEGQSAAGGITNGAPGGGFTAPAANFAYTAPTSFAITAEDLPSDSVEGLYLKRTPLGNKAVDIANRTGLGNEKTFDQATSGGTGGLISTLSGVSDSLVSTGADVMKPYFASVDTAGATYASGGGGGSSGASAAAPTPLNFGSLLGGEGEAGGGSGVTEDSFRAPAKVTSIFHEDTNQNIFQIVSGKLENLQQQARIPVGVVR